MVMWQSWVSVESRVLWVGVVGSRGPSALCWERKGGDVAVVGVRVGSKVLWAGVVGS